MSDIDEEMPPDFGVKEPAEKDEIENDNVFTEAKEAQDTVKEANDKQIDESKMLNDSDDEAENNQEFADAMIEKEVEPRSVSEQLKSQSSPPPTDSTTLQAEAQATNKPTLGWNDVAVSVQPYNMELCPPGFLHGVFGFTQMASQYYIETVGSEKTSPIYKVMKMLAPKVSELKESRRFRLENFSKEFQVRLGEGSFGEVYKQTFRLKTKVALKRFKNYSDPLPIYKETHTLIALQHPRIVTLYGAFHERGTFLVMELCLGNLRNFLKVLTAKQKARFAIQILEGLQHMHSKNIIHCDFKPDNVFINEHNNAVIGDFGNAHLIPEGFNFIRVHSKKPCLGSPGYSDALANDRVYSNATDIFGAGCTLYEIDRAQPLMEYPHWHKVPVKEYVRCVEEGRLIHVPLPIPGAPLQNFDGERETLYARSQQSVMFRELLPEMIKNASKRLGAAEILQNFRHVFTASLMAVHSSWVDLDTDPKLGQVSLNSSVIQPLELEKLSHDIDVAMDLIYWDCKMDVDECVVTEQPNEIDVVRIEDVKILVEKFLRDRSIRVCQPNDDLPLSLAAASVMKKAERIAVDRVLGTVMEPISAQEVPVTIPSVSSGKMPTENFPPLVVPLGKQSAPLSSLSTTNTQDKGVKAPEAHHYASETMMESTSLAASDSMNVVNEESFAGKRKRVEGHILKSQEKLAVKEDVEVKKKKKDKKKSKRTKEEKATSEGCKGSFAGSNVSAELPIDKAKQRHSTVPKEKKDKEWYVRRGETVPLDLRGIAPAAVNVPENVKLPRKWNKWFDCPHCSFYTHDYKECTNHSLLCSSRPPLSK